MGKNPTGKMSHRKANLTGATVPAQTGEHDLTDGALKHALGVRDGVIQTGAFFQLSLVHGGFGQDMPGGFAATGAQGVQVVGEPGRAANRKRGMLFV